jgi:hypothetical protein
MLRDAGDRRLAQHLLELFRNPASSNPGDAHRRSFSRCVKSGDNSRRLDRLAGQLSTGGAQLPLPPASQDDNWATNRNGRALFVTILRGITDLSNDSADIAHALRQLFLRNDQNHLLHLVDMVQGGGALDNHAYVMMDVLVKCIDDSQLGVRGSGRSTAAVAAWNAWTPGADVSSSIDELISIGPKFLDPDGSMGFADGGLFTNHMAIVEMYKRFVLGFSNLPKKQRLAARLHGILESHRASGAAPPFEHTSKSELMAYYGLNNPTLVDRIREVVASDDYTTSKESPKRPSPSPAPAAPAAATTPAPAPSAPAPASAARNRPVAAVGGNGLQLGARAPAPAAPAPSPAAAPATATEQPRQIAKQVGRRFYTPPPEFYPLAFNPPVDFVCYSLAPSKG